MRVSIRPIQTKYLAAGLRALILGATLGTLYILLTTAYIHRLQLRGWQDFVGALVGAMVAIIIFLLTQVYKPIKERKDHLHLLHRSIGAALGNLRDIDLTMHDFSEVRIPKLISSIDKDIKNAHPVVCYAFVPLTGVFELSPELLRTPSGSGYVDVQTISLLNSSEALPRIVDDINRQFEATISMNNQIALSGINTNPLTQSLSFRTSILTFKNQVLDTDLQSTVRSYARELIKAQIAVSMVKRDFGVWRWKLKFFHLPEASAHQQIDEYLEAFVEERIAKYQPAFKTKL